MGHFGPGSGPGGGGGQGPGRGWDRAEARLKRKSQMPLLLSFGAPVCFLRGFGGCELLSIAGAAAGGGVLTAAPSSFTPRVGLQLPPFLGDSSALVPKPVANRTSVC